MTAQIRPNRMEVSDRFPMLGFAVRTDEPNVEAEVVLANDIGLFGGQNRNRRTAANFYSSREHGTLTVPRGEGVFVVPPDVLARFIGSEKIYFGLATGHGGNGGLNVDAVPRDGSPYVSLRGFTGRTLRRSFGGSRGTSSPRLEWTGDAPKPGSEAAQGSAPVPSNGSGTATTPPPAGHYDDGFGPMPAIPAKESSYRPRAGTPVQAKAVGITMGAGTTAASALNWIRTKIEQGVQAAGSHVDPPSMYYLGDNSANFIRAWQIVFGATSLFVPTNAFLAAIPTLAEKSDVTLSIGPILDTPLFGGGVGAVFTPDGQVGLFGGGEISADFDSLLEFAKSLKLALTAKMKLGYNRGGLAAFADIGTVAAVNVGDEIAVGAEIWLDSSGSGIGGAVSIGVGFDVQLGVEPRPARQVGLTMSSGTTAATALNWIRTKIEQGVQAAGSHVDPPSMYYLGDNSSTFVTAWKAVHTAASLFSPFSAFLAALPSLAASSEVTLSIGPALDTPLFGAGVGVVFAPDGQVALFGTGEISVDFDGLTEFVKSLKLALAAKMKLGYNQGGLAKFADLGTVAGVNVGEELVGGAEIWLDSSGSGIGGAVSIGVGFALQLAEQEATASAAPAYVPPSLPSDPRQRANRIGGGFGQRIGEALDLGLDATTIAPLLDRLDAPMTAKPMGFARSLGATTWSINWDGIDPVPQPTGDSCWATTLSMLKGWYESKSIAPSWIAQQCGRTLNEGLPWANRADAAAALGFGTLAPQCYTPEGFASLIENNGPLYVGKIMSDTIKSGHAVLVVGMYSDGTDYFLRVVDPWDRGAGTPGAPDPYSSSHNTGSSYIMRYEDFQNQYEMAAAGNPAYVQIIYAGVPSGKTINRGTGAPAGFAMGSRAILAPPPSRPRSAARPAQQLDVTDLIAGVAVAIRDSVDGDIDWHLPEWKGPKHPNDRPPATEAPYQEGTVYVAGWPSAGWRTSESAYAYPTIRWTYNGTSIGRIFVEEGSHHDPAGFGVTVRGQLKELPPTATRSPQALVPGPNDIAAMTVVFNYNFQAPPGEKDPAAEVRVVLYADGTHEVHGRWLADESGWTWKSDGDGTEKPRTSLPYPVG
jgi:Papain-like cysteine protease AvrRpt2